MYKKLSIVLFIIILSLVFYIYYDSVNKESKIGIIDMDLVLEESIRAKELQSELEKRGDQIESKYEDLKLEDEDVDNQIYMEFMQNKQKIEEKLNSEIELVLDQILQEENYSVILYKKQTYFGGQDITSKVIKLLDEQFIKKNIEKGTDS
ncbi:MAG: hypothetical protein K9K32_00385 [Halanaerobiales bacterium]|nr:hypothetical protein [Halanaerobiales bacterium]